MKPYLHLQNPLVLGWRINLHISYLHSEVWHPYHIFVKNLNVLIVKLLNFEENEEHQKNRQNISYHSYKPSLFNMQLCLLLVRKSDVVLHASGYHHEERGRFLVNINSIEAFFLNHVWELISLYSLELSGILVSNVKLHVLRVDFAFLLEVAFLQSYLSENTILLRAFENCIEITLGCVNVIVGGWVKHFRIDQCCQEINLIRLLGFFGLL